MKNELLVQKSKIEKELLRIAKKGIDEESYVTKFPNLGDEIDDNAEEIVEFDQNLAIEKNLEPMLRDIKSALSQIEKGTYGVCKYCKKPIDLKRMEARPFSSSCISCKSRIQKQ